MNELCIILSKFLGLSLQGLSVHTSYRQHQSTSDNFQNYGIKTQSLSHYFRTFVDTTTRRVLDKVSNLPCFSTSCTVTLAASLLGAVVSSRYSCGLMAAAPVTQVNKHGLSGLCVKQAFYKRLGVEGSSSCGACFNSGRQPEAVSSRYPIYLHHPPKPPLKT